MLFRPDTTFTCSCPLNTWPQKYCARPWGRGLTECIFSYLISLKCNGWFLSIYRALIFISLQTFSAIPLTLTWLLHVSAFNAKTSIFRLDGKSQSPTLLCFLLASFSLLPFFFLFEGRISSLSSTRMISFPAIPLSGAYKVIVTLNFSHLLA